MTNKILVIVDMQNDFVSGSLGTPEAQAAAERLRWFLDAIYDVPVYDTIYATLDMHDGTYLSTQEGRNLPVQHCVIGTDGVEVCSEIKDILTKIESYNDHQGTHVVYLPKAQFGYPKWKTMLDKHNIDEIDIVGVCTDICVITNALALKTLCPEAKIRVIEDLCAGTTPEMHKAALNVMQSCQIEIC